MEKEFLVSNSFNEAVLLKDENHIFYAGGTEINRLNSGLSQKSVISLKKLNLSEISKSDGVIRIGSTATFQQIIDSPAVPAYLKKACYFMASRTKRNMATIGGNIYLKRTDSYLIPTLVVAHAKLILQNKVKGCFEVYLFDYIKGKEDYSDCLIVRVELPDSNMNVRSKRCSVTALSHAFVTVALSCENRKYTLFAGLKNSGFVELNTLVHILDKKPSITCEEVCSLVKSTNEIRFYEDIYGSVEYKKYILGVSVYELLTNTKGDDIL